MKDRCQVRFAEKHEHTILANQTDTVELPTEESIYDELKQLGSYLTTLSENRPETLGELVEKIKIALRRLPKVLKAALYLYNQQQLSVEKKEVS